MENVASSIFNGLGWGIVHSLWIGALLYVALLLAFQFLNGRARTKSLLLAAALSVLLASFCLTVLAGLSGRPIPDVGAVPDGDGIFSVLRDYSGSFSFKVHVEHYFPIVIAFYVMGVLLQSVVVINGFRKLRMMRRRGLLAVPSSWRALLTSKKQQMGLRIPIAFHLSTLVDVPAVVGHLKPMILFPVALYSRISMAQVEAVLIHELAHIKRRDYLINLVKIFTETLLFFNPFVWLIGRMLETERENACDDVVVNLTSRPVHYARTLLWLEEVQQEPNHRLAMQAVTRKKQLLHRIQRMTNMKTNYLNAKHKLAILTLLLGCIASLAWVKPFAWDAEPMETPVLPTAVIDTVTFVADDSAQAMVFQAVANDARPSARKSGITFVGSDGTTQAFESYGALSDTLKVKVDSLQHQTDTIRAFYDSPETKEELRKMITQVRKQTDSLRAYFSSPEWRDQIKGYMDSVKVYFNSREWKNKMESLRKESKGVDTTLVFPTMTITGKKHQMEQLLEQKKALRQYQATHRKALAALRQPYASAKESKAQLYKALLEQRDRQYIDGSVKPWLVVEGRNIH